MCPRRIENNASEGKNQDQEGKPFSTREREKNVQGKALKQGGIFRQGHPQRGKKKKKLLKGVLMTRRNKGPGPTWPFGCPAVGHVGVGEGHTGKKAIEKQTKREEE